MNFLQNIISEELIYALGWTVMHSLWQGFVIAIMMAFALQLLRKKSARVRYETATISLFLVLVSAVCTFIWYYDSAGQSMEQEVLTLGHHLSANAFSEATGTDEFAQSFVAYFNNHLPLIVLIWLVGVAFFILRLCGGLAYVQRLKYHRNNLLSPYWQEKVQLLSSKIPMKKTVKIFESAVVKVPMVIGYFKPFILLPIGTINQLQESEIEAIIAHELAHVFRNDFLMNIALSFIEVFFYYHPAVWWISGNVKLERENCCDDIAVKVCGNSLAYAKALIQLQELNVYVPRLAMPFSGQKNQLLNRIKRILNQPQTRSNIVEKLMATCLLLLAIVFMSVSASVSEQQNIEEVELSVIDIETEADYKTIKVKVVTDIINEGKSKSKDEIFHIPLSREEALEVKLDRKVISSEELETLEIVETNGQVKIKKLNQLPFQASPFFYISNDTVPPLKKSSINGSLPFRKNKKQQTITRKTNDDGQTIIIIEELGRESVEIVLEEDNILVKGNKLEDGDTAIIIDNNLHSSDFPERFYFFSDDKILLDGDSSIWQDYKIAKAKHKELFKNNGNNFRFGITDESGALWPSHIDSLRGNTWKILERSSQDHERSKMRLRETQEQLRSRINENNEKFLLENREKRTRDFLIEKRHKLGVERDQLFKENNLYFFDSEERILGKNSTAQKIAQQLKLDKLIDDIDNFSFSMSNKRLKINGEKQSQAILKKYKCLYEKLSGKILAEKENLQINVSRN